jgi:hypothetical protein
MHRFPGLLVLLALLAAAPPAFACTQVQEQEIDPCTGRPRVVAAPLPGDPVTDAPAPGAPEAPDATPAGGPPPADTARSEVPPPRSATEVDTASAERFREALGLGRLSRGVRSGPAASLSVPTGLGAQAGEVFVGIGFQARTRYTDDADAGAVLGVGLGDARTLALEVALSSYSTLRSVPFETGGVSARLHRVVGEELGVAAGWENLLGWGDLDAQSSLYVAATRLLRLRDDPRAPLSSVALTLGAGNGRFRSEADDAAGRESVNVFGAVGVRVLEPLSLVADWTGQDLNAGVSLTPLPRVPLVVTAGAADLTGSAGDGARFILSVGFGFAVPWRL